MPAATYEHVCEICGQTFRSRKRQQRTCSYSCRGKLGARGRQPVQRSPCSVKGCDREARSRGLCNRHYENVRRYGQAVGFRHLPAIERIERIGWTVTASGCWEWNGRRNDLGYGLLNHQRVHRLYYCAIEGMDLTGLVLRHRCDNPPCINPAHLLPGTQAENFADMTARSRGHWQRLT